MVAGILRWALQNHVDFVWNMCGNSCSQITFASLLGFPNQYCYAFFSKSEELRALIEKEQINIECIDYEFDLLYA